MTFHLWLNLDFWTLTWPGVSWIDFSAFYLYRCMFFYYYYLLVEATNFQMFEKRAWIEFLTVWHMQRALWTVACMHVSINDSMNMSKTQLLYITMLPTNKMGPRHQVWTLAFLHPRVFNLFPNMLFMWAADQKFIRYVIKSS